ncbi:MAG: PEP/pyruvate-binding domain-containing protein [Desulfobacterales bacterium]
MAGDPGHPLSEFYPDFKIYHELMRIKVREILLVSSPYDAFIMEEDGSLASRIINEYSGLNLSHPPRVTRTASAENAVSLLYGKSFDLVLTMPYLEETDACSLGRSIKAVRPDLPVILLANSLRSLQMLPEDRLCSGIDKTFIWTGNSDLLLAIVKNVEDRLNVEADTKRAQVRVLILVEDSPAYYSSILPLIYKEIVRQTQVVLGSGLNEEHRLLKMRARPKILHARSFEEALQLYERYRPYVFGVLSDTRLPKADRLCNDAGFDLLSRIRSDFQDLPLLLLSSNPANAARAAEIPAAFLDKNSPNLLAEIHDFFLSHLGFGDFIFRLPDGKEIDRASDLRDLEKKVAEIPDASLWYHAERNHFSNWLMGRSEIGLGSTFRAVYASDFESTEALRRYIVSSLHALRKWRQKGVVALFSEKHFDADLMDFVKVGHGSLGGKARGLAFMAALLQRQSGLNALFPGVTVRIPKTFVITTEGFESFISDNDLSTLASEHLTDAQIAERFLEGRMPEWLMEILQHFLSQVRYPLSVRSSSLLEDAHFQPYAGLYATYMIPNNHPDAEVRVRQLVDAVKLVYASTYMESPRAYSRTVASQPQEEAMAVVIQELAGERYGDHFYPALSGVAQSHNFYPVGPMKSGEGIAQIALGIGKTVVEGERALRFCPKYPEILPQFSTVEDILGNSQQHFYALKIQGYPEKLAYDPDSNLARRLVEEADDEFPVRLLASTYIPDDHRIRDSGFLPGPKVLTFASVLKHDRFPLPEILKELLDLGRQGMGSPVEMEFAVNLGTEQLPRSEFLFLQLRPVAVGADRTQVEITEDEIGSALCYCDNALGNGRFEALSDVVFVKPDAFRADATRRMAEEIGRINARLRSAGRPYLLVGPGRWGSSDPWLGVPVRWHHISGVEAIVEIRGDILNAEPSQGSHFFQNITAMGIPYLTIVEGGGGWFEWERLLDMPVESDGPFVRHVRCDPPLVIKVDGRQSLAVIVSS